MKALHIKGTTDEPTVTFNHSTGELFMGGSSLPSNIVEFYESVFCWIDDYKQQAPGKTHVEFNFEYLNSASANIVVRIIDSLQELVGFDKRISFTWNYCTGDYDMKELALELFDGTECQFELVEVKEYYRYEPMAA